MKKRLVADGAVLLNSSFEIRTSSFLSRARDVAAKKKKDSLSAVPSKILANQ
jgi:hypothetical protein